MSTNYKGIDLLLGNIPSFQLTSGQTARWRKGGLSPTCMFLRDPIGLSLSYLAYERHTDLRCTKE